MGKQSRRFSRPFFENKTNDDYMEWFTHVEPWNKLDSRITEILVDRFDGDPAFEAFVHVSQELNLVPKYIRLQSLLNTDGGRFAICPRIAVELSDAAEHCHSSVGRILESNDKDTDKLKKHWINCVFALESAIYIEPNLLPAYVQMASFKAMVGKNDDAKQYCMKGLEKVEQLKAGPFCKSEIPSISNATVAFGGVELRLKEILAALPI